MPSPVIHEESVQCNDDGYSLGNQQCLPDQQSSISEESGNDVSNVHIKRQKLRLLSSKTKEKTKRILHINDGGETVSNGAYEGTGIIENDPAFNPSMLQRQQHTTTEDSKGKTRENLQSVAAAILHPKKSIKSKATKITAGKLSNVERPYLSRNADVDFLNAHTEMNQASSSTPPLHNKPEDNRKEVANGCRNKFVEMEAHRESLRVAWITSKHISRVRVVPKRHVKYPDTAKFYVKDDNDSLKFDWLRWLGYYIIYYTQDFSVQYIDDFDELPFDVDSLRHHVERVVVASAPWQSWAMSVRSVYRWENPYMTGKWLAIYVALWYTEHLMGFLYGYIIFIVIKNLYFPTSVKSLRNSMQRALDGNDKPRKFGELIDRHGHDSWLEPLLEDLGPYIQLQVGDVANMLEVFHNFYHWKSPRKTAASLFFLLSCLLLTLFADMKFCMKIVWFIIGGSFFLCWPIASLYPKYRYLVSPFKWVLWDIPTDAEWAFQYLRRQAQTSRERMIQQKFKQGLEREVANASMSNPNGFTTPPSVPSNADSDTDDLDSWNSTSSPTRILDSTTISSFRARSLGKTGHLIIHPAGIRFIRSLNKTQLWSRTYLELAEMRKLEGSPLSKLSLKSLEQLELKFAAGDVVLLEAMRERDEAFNAIIGFSALQWQALQTNPTKVAESTTGDK